MFQRLVQAGFEIEIKNHASAIMAVDFPGEILEIEDALLAVSIPSEEIIASGGGEAQSTQRLRGLLTQSGWPKHNFLFEKLIDGVPQESITHEIDHVRRSANGTIALEIEWNNKDPFFDRDLENFQRLHAQTAISIGVIITRGSSMQAGMADIVADCLDKHQIADEAQAVAAFSMKDRTARQRDAVAARMRRRKNPLPFRRAFAECFVADKFGAATTHWSKLRERTSRGVGNPCPLVLVGLPASVIVP